MCRNHAERTERPVTDGEYSSAVVSAVADQSSADVAEVSNRLYDRIDPDALDAIFSDRYDGTARAGGRIVFTVCGCRVVVRSDDVVSARRSGDPDASADGASATFD